MPKKRELRFVGLLFCAYHVDDQAHYYGDYDDNYEVCCSLDEWYVPF